MLYLLFELMYAEYALSQDISIKKTWLTSLRRPHTHASFPWEPASFLKHVEYPAYLIGRSAFCNHSSVCWELLDINVSPGECGDSPGPRGAALKWR
jgi:hypothetical protein